MSVLLSGLSLVLLTIVPWRARLVRLDVAVAVFSAPL